MKKLVKLTITFSLVICFCFMSSSAFAALSGVREGFAIPDFGDKTAVKEFWNQRHTFDEYEELFVYLQAKYPDTVKLYSIGHTWEERDIWCLEITKNVNDSTETSKKTPIALIGNIHGGEQEGAESVAYTAWWLASGYAARNSEATSVMEGYVCYIIPVMNADGYVRSMYVNTRQNMRPRGLGRDEYFDRNGDDKVGQMFVGTAATHPSDPTTANALATSANYAKDGGTYLGYEAYDTDGNGIFGDSTKQSAIDLNRSFDYFWTLYRPSNSFSANDGYPQLGANNTWNANPTLASAGPGPATEPEVQAIQNFLYKYTPRALVTAHTGIQCVLYPWCYTPEPTDDHALLSATAEKMRKAYEKTVQTVRPNVRFYQMQSYEDYPTAAEMIDWAYGRLGTHAYTVEVYSRGAANADPTSNDYYRWDDAAHWTTNFPAQWKYIGPITDGQSGSNTPKTYEHVWVYYSAAQMRAGEAPPDQYIMTQGFKDSALAMIFSEPAYNSGTPTRPSGGSSGSSTTQLAQITVDGTAYPASIFDTTKNSYTIEATPKEGSKQVYVTIPATTLAGLELQNSNFSIYIKTPFGVYKMPANLAQIIEGLDDSELRNASFRITLTDKSDDATVLDAFQKSLPNAKALSGFVDFKLELVNTSSNTVIKQLNNFTRTIERLLPLSEGISQLPQYYGAFRYNETNKAFAFVPHRSTSFESNPYVAVPVASNSIYVVAENSLTFNDVATGSWYAAWVSKAAAKSLVQGVGNNLYQPSHNATRAEFVQMIANAMLLPEGTATAYADVASDKWYYSAVMRAKALGLLDQFTENNFNPNQPITREEMATILGAVLRAFEVSSTASVTGFTDYGSMNTAYIQDIELVYGAGLMQGVGENKFDPKGVTTRAQAATVQIRLLETLNMLDK